MEVGKIYKVDYSKGQHVGIVLSRKVTNISWNVVEMVVTMCTIAGEEVKMEEPSITNISSARLKPEVRASLRKLYKLYLENERIKEDMEALNKATQKNRHELLIEKEHIKVYSNQFTMNDLASYFRSISSYSTDPMRLEFTMSMQKTIEKYASPDSHSFLSREYDGAVYVDDFESCIRQCGIRIPVMEIELLKEMLKHTVLYKVDDGAEIGDKNFLFVYKNLHFRIKPGTTYSQMKTECELIEEWIKNKEKQFSH